MGWFRAIVLSVLCLIGLRAAMACTSFSTDDDVPGDAATNADAVVSPPLDGPSPFDAAADAPTDVQRLDCATKDVFCDGFERDPEAGVIGEWNAIELGADGGTGVKLAIVDVSAAGGVRSFHATGMQGAGSLHKTISADGVHEVSFFLHVEALPDDAVVAQFAFVNPPGPPTGVSIALEKKGIKLTEQLLGLSPAESAYRAGTVTALPVGQWVPIYFKIDSGAAKLATLEIPGATLTLSIQNPLLKAQTFAFGLPYLGKQGKTFTIFLDDVALR